MELAEITDLDKMLLNTDEKILDVANLLPMPFDPKFY
jgi:hypothetical protein